MNIFKKIFSTKSAPRLEYVFDEFSPLTNLTLISPRCGISKSFNNLINQPSTQIIVYGKKRVGKSTLMIRILDDFCSQKQITRLRIVCNQKMTAHSFMSLILDSLGTFKTKEFVEFNRNEETNFVQLSPGPIMMGFKENKQKELQIKRSAWNLDIIVEKLVKVLLDRGTILFLDDVERVMDFELIDCIQVLARLLSDSENNCHRMKAKLIISYSSPDKEKIGKKFDVESNGFKMIEIPPMTADEIYKLVSLGSQAAFMNLSENVIQNIVRMSDGMPAKANSICLQTGLAIAEFWGIKDNRLTGDEPEVSEFWFNKYVMPLISDNLNKKTALV